MIDTQEVYTSRYTRDQRKVFHYTVFQVSICVIYIENVDILVFACYKGSSNIEVMTSSL